MEDLIATIEQLQAQAREGMKRASKDSDPYLYQYMVGKYHAFGNVAGILKKQKEQPKEELVYRLNGLMQDYIKEGKDDEEKEHRFKCYQLFWDALENTSYFEQEEQKPVERSLEDDHIIGFVYDLLNEIEWKDNWAMSKDECLRRLNNYRPQPKREWSEEDEDMLNSCISSIEEAKENRYAYKETDGDTSYDHEIAWLKSLRPQPHWKPSEEQISAFKGYIEDFQARAEAAVGGWNNFDVMIRLYEQLKKL